MPVTIEPLERRSMLAVDLSSIATQSVPAGTTLFVPLKSDGASSVSYSAASSNSAVKLALSNNTTYLTMAVQNRGEMVFQLFNDIAPKTVARITGMARAGFYNNQRFHRVIQNFVIQAGDPKSKQPNSTGNDWGTGGPATTFDDEFNPNAIFNGNGQLAMANSGKDTNGSQFFVTVGQNRELDFNHTIFGQLVRGFETLTAINNVPTFNDERPVFDEVITSVTVVSNRTDGVLKITVPTGSSQNQLSTITVTAKGSDGSTDASAFKVNKTTNTTNDPPILSPVADSIVVAKNGTATIRLASVDRDGGAVVYGAEFVLRNGATGNLNGNVLTITPAANFTGAIVMVVGVKADGATSRGSSEFESAKALDGIYDTQEIIFAVGDKAASGNGVNVDLAKDVRGSNALVTSFTDGDAAGAASNWSSRVDWGDGTASDGTVVKVAAGKFDIRGSHTYNVAGTYPVTVTLVGNLGAVRTFSSTAYVRNFAGLTGGVLTVNGSGTNDVLSLTKTSSNRINVTLGGVSRSYAFGSVTKIVIDGLDGNDNIALESELTQPTSIKGGNGRDTIIGGGGKDTIFGGNQNDSLVGGDAVDSIFGEQGNDTLLGNAGNDRLDGGTESDTAENAGGDTRISIETLL